MQAPKEAGERQACEIKVGDIVRVRDPSQYISSMRSKRLADRDGVVEFVFEGNGLRLGYTANVRLLKRNGRGKEFTERVRIADLIVVENKEEKLASNQMQRRRWDTTQSRC